MIFNWMHQKFIERFFDPKSKQNDLRKYDEQNYFNFPIGIGGHRYRYHIPQVNPKKSPFHHGILNENFFYKNDNAKNSDANKENLENNFHDKNTSSSFIKIKFYAIPVKSKMTKEEIQKSITDCKKNIHPNIFRFLVLPLADRDSQHSEMEKSSHFDVTSKKDLSSDIYFDEIIDDDNEDISLIDEREIPCNDLPNHHFCQNKPIEEEAHKIDEIPSCSDNKMKSCQTKEEYEAELLLNNDWLDEEFDFEDSISPGTFRYKFEKYMQLDNSKNSFITFFRKLLFNLTETQHDERRKNSDS